MNGLNGKHAVITGAGAGIGKAVAIRLAEEGARVSLLELNRERAETACAEIRAKGGQALPLLGDVSKWDDVNAAIEQARKEFGPVDILVNNAGGSFVGGQIPAFWDCDEAYMDKLIGINLMGTLYCTRAVLDEMRQRKTGRIISMSSIRAIGGDRNVLYSSSKGAIISMTRSLALVMGKYGVTANAIAPGAIASRPAPASCPTRLGHPGKCEDVAALVCFLASDEGSFITGETIVIDGGRTIGCMGE